MKYLENKFKGSDLKWSITKEYDPTLPILRYSEGNFIAEKKS